MTKSPKAQTRLHHDALVKISELAATAFYDRSIRRAHLDAILLHISRLAEESGASLT